MEATLISGEIKRRDSSGIEVLVNIGFVKICFNGTHESINGDLNLEGKSKGLLLGWIACIKSEQVT